MDYRYKINCFENLNNLASQKVNLQKKWVTGYVSRPVLVKSNFVGYNVMWVTLLTYFTGLSGIYIKRYWQILCRRMIVKGWKFSYIQFLWVTSHNKVQKMWVIYNKQVYHFGAGIKFFNSPFKQHGINFRKYLYQVRCMGAKFLGYRDGTTQVATTVLPIC